MRSACTARAIIHAGGLRKSCACSRSLGHARGAPEAVCHRCFVHRGGRQHHQVTARLALVKGLAAEQPGRF